ncbi:MAG TPA: BPSS1780 family membrane protein [Azospira sp.]|nr:BPSS1780 family membrane protein [Azospira sp.]
MSADPHSPDATPAFPLAPPPFDGDCRVVPAAAAIEWLRFGWELFSRAPGAWALMALVFLVLTLAVTMVPVAGALASHLLLPLLAAGVLQAVRRQEEGGAVEVGDLFVGFSRETTGLLLVGLFYMLGWFAILAIGMLIGGGSLIGGAAAGSAGGLGVAIAGVLVAILISLALAVPLFMAFWFAPALVYFNHMAPVAALKASFHACLKNFLAFSVFGLIIGLLFFIAALPMGLGFLVLLPVSFAGLYASYRDVFPSA